MAQSVRLPHGLRSLVVVYSCVLPPMDHICVRDGSGHYTVRQTAEHSLLSLRRRVDKQDDNDVKSDAWPDGYILAHRRSR